MVSCPIGLASELRDKWMPIILAILACSNVHLISFNTIGRVSSLSRTKLVSSVGDYLRPREHKQKKLYYLTESGIDFSGKERQDGPQRASPER